MSIKKQEVSFLEIAKVFTLIGTVGFGGGMAIIALIQDYCVGRKKWLSQEELSHGIAFGQLLGPFAVNASIFVGYRLRGLRGALIALIAFLMPSIVLVIIISEFYMRFNQVPSLQAALRGIGPVVVALILSAAYQMSEKKMKSFESIFLALGAIFLSVVMKFQVIGILLIAVGYGFLKMKVFKRGPLENA